MLHVDHFFLEFPRTNLLTNIYALITGKYAIRDEAKVKSGLVTKATINVPAVYKIRKI